jgi:DoxX-like family
MDIAVIALSVLLAAMLAASALRKLGHREDVVAGYTRVGVPAERLDYLAYILLAGAAGLLVGLFWPPLGIAAAAGVLLYFLLAVAAHIRSGDTAHMQPPATIALFAAITLAVRIASA